ncbi:MAG: hypothetical protein V1729_06225 [Candidatus Woesearchaeota archaeon]
MKKVIALLILLVLVFTLGCSAKTAQQHTTKDTGAIQADTISEEVDSIDTELEGIDDLDDDFLDSDLDSLDSELDLEI